MMHHMSQIKASIYKGENVEDSMVRDVHVVYISNASTHNHTCEACYTLIAKQSLTIL